MKPEPQTLTEYKKAYDKLIAEKAAFKSYQAELEEQVDVAKRIIGRYKRKFGSLDDKPPE